MYLQINNNMKPRARAMRKTGNYAEVLLWRELSGKKMLGFDFDRQKVIGSYIADFASEMAGVVVEIDGSSHIGREEYDKVRNEYMQAVGFTVLRFSDLDIKHNLALVLHEIEKACLPRVGSRRHPVQ